jgi:phage terminase large subunit-like protein
MSYYLEEKAEQAIRFIKSLKHTKGKWRGVNFTLLPWQELALKDIFGTLKESGYRQYNTAYLEVPKKNGKSELGAGIALKMLAGDNEWAAEVYGCAADRAQASIIFDVAVDMVDQCPPLKKHIKPILSQKRLVYMPTKSFYQVLSAEAFTKHGLNVHGVIFDELHAQPNRELFDVMTDGSGDARTQPLFFIISTAGDDADRSSIGWEVHQMAIDILTGIKIDPTFYAMIYGLDKDNKRIWGGKDYEVIKKDISDDSAWREIWANKDTWKKINPSIGHTITMEKVEEQYTRAKTNLAKEKNFRWLRLNSWEKLKLHKWLSLDFWDLCKEKIDEAKLIGRPCYGGLDLSSTIDLTSFVLVFPPDDINRKWIALPWFWVPEDNVAERVRTDKVAYDVWAKRGYMKLTPGNVIDYDFIIKEIEEAAGMFNIIQIGYDSWSAMQTAIKLEDKGMTMVEVRQGPKSMSPAMKKIEQIVKSKELNHGGHPVLRWNVGNVEVKSDESENIKPVKSKSAERIDGLVAFVNAMARAILQEDDSSRYDDPDAEIMTI